MGRMTLRHKTGAGDVRGSRLGKAGGAIMVLAAFAAAGCNRGKPSGQVVATVDGEEITAAELRLEMANAGGSESQQQAVVQQLIARKLLFKEAQRENLDKSADAKALQERAEELALAQLLESKMARDIPVDESQTAMDRFIAAHPAQFAGRRLITAEQLVVPPEAAPLVPQISALKSIPAIEALLNQNNIAYIRTQSVVDTATMPTELAAKVSALQPDAVFVSPAANGPVQVSRIISSRVQPLAGDEARNVARTLIGQTRAGAMRERMRKLVQDGQKQVWIDPALGRT